ncbi:substrate-binding periplasmic protein [Legionella micdadei]|uniref:Amino acid ABC transporter substrate-binding protein, PAAT family (TC 3.A.1.3.-) n=1 Tax=Legionella micdadei TaxID=451 RepID=A0A098GBN0_LEGMI|nr:ABC transporter substrate-binding protein [Legionella micdadei]ARG98414.1 amino acid ABC transporter substrate-binding protein [Legionella micdadei]ARH01164.1 amino acid ABC transporter substrate-binding protein [Legionella micdadei]KTD30379.1 amino acid ABC transporter substrate-binding protein [Legionella micdadei]NSL18346.1 amino acid ABC transporter substrate-binding protein [Legionella micdadei]CEG59903.1 Arogenate dehydratase [Legionella micdadei]
MNKIILSLIICSVLFIAACTDSNKKNEAKVIHFATSAEYPPFEYEEHGVIKGFDIELAKLIAKELGKEAVFDNMQFSSILPALTSGQADAAISTITITYDRKKNFDFTTPYYFEGMAAVFKKDYPINSPSQLAGKKIAAQLGSTMEIWLKKHAQDEQIVPMDNNNQAIEALKAGHIDVVLMDGAQGAIFSQKNPGLSYAIIAKAEDGYGIALPKNSLMTARINRILNTLKEKGEIAKLQKTWLEGI